MIPPLSALQAFEAIARRKSFSLAATELHLTPSAVSHQVAKLESLLINIIAWLGSAGTKN